MSWWEGFANVSVKNYSDTMTDSIGQTQPEPINMLEIGPFGAQTRSRSSGPTGDETRIP